MYILKNACYMYVLGKDASVLALIEPLTIYYTIVLWFFLCRSRI